MIQKGVSKARATARLPTRPDLRRLTRQVLQVAELSSLACQGQIIPSPSHSLQSEDLWKPSFLEGTVLN